MVIIFGRGVGLGEKCGRESSWWGGVGGELEISSSARCLQSPYYIHDGREESTLR